MRASEAAQVSTTAADRIFRGIDPDTRSRSELILHRTIGSVTPLIVDYSENSHFTS